MKTGTVIVPCIMTLTACMMAADISKIHVLTSGRVTTYSPDGREINPTITMGACCPTGMALDAAGRIYISSDSAPKRIAAFTQDGQEVPVPAGFGFYNTRGVAIDPQGNIVVLGRDPRNAVWVNRITPAGERLRIMFDMDGGWVHMAVDAGGRIYVLGMSGVLNVAEAGSPVKTSRSGPGESYAIAIGPDGKMYIGKWLSVISFLPGGEQTPLKITHLNSLGGWATPIALAADSKGRIYVGYNVARQYSVVAIYNPDGTVAAPDIRTLPGIQAITVR